MEKSTPIMPKQICTDIEREPRSTQSLETEKDNPCVNNGNLSSIISRFGPPLLLSLNVNSSFVETPLKKACTNLSQLSTSEGKKDLQKKSDNNTEESNDCDKDDNDDTRTHLVDMCQSSSSSSDTSQTSKKISRYNNYIYSVTFLTDTLENCMRKCSYFSQDESEEISTFWKINLNFILNLIEQDHIGAVYSLRDIIRGGTVDKLRSYFDGLILGITIGRSKVNRDVAEEIVNINNPMIEAQNYLLKEIENHHSRSLKYLKQINQGFKIMKDLHIALN